MLFKVIAGFLFGLGSGVYVFVKFAHTYLPSEKILSEKVEHKNTEIALTASPVPSLSPIPKSPTPTPVPSTANEEMVKISPTKTPSPTKKPPSSTPKPAATQTPKPSQIIPTNSPSPTVEVAITIQVATSLEINSYIDKFAGQYGVDANVLRHIATCESGFNPLATNGPYSGLYQFSISSWKNYRNQIGENNAEELRLSAEEAVQTAAYVISIGKSSIWPNCLP